MVAIVLNVQAGASQPPRFFTTTAHMEESGEPCCKRVHCDTEMEGVTQTSGPALILPTYLTSRPYSHLYGVCGYVPTALGDEGSFGFLFRYQASVIGRLVGR